MLASGTQLGPYEILAPLGAGGMGEVYRAKDARLGREVAVKVLPAAYAADADRLRRFEQEARAAGALNHPNILTIHDIGMHEGAPYVVSELLEGETLRERMGGAAIPQRKALDYARQIAQGLAAAHAKGIVHRDLKPENLFVTADGRLKILDFGLAKLTQAENVSLTSAPTVAAATEPGAVLGTVGYMSPEQVRGKPADHRADIFSFGAVLYEMLAGRRAFGGESSVEAMNAILKEDPPELVLPPGLDRIVRHCLEKSPEERFQSARDLAFDLEAVSGSSTESGPRVLARRRRGPALQVVAAVVLVAVGILVGQRLGKTPPPLFQQLTFRRGTIQGGRFAPDGRTIIYAAAWDGGPIELYSTRPESPESRSLGFPPAGILAVAPSGELAISLGCRFPAAFGQIGTLAQVPLAGGAPREVQEEVELADWAPDGKQLLITRGASSFRDRLEFPIGKVLYERTSGGWIGNPRLSPKGDLIGFLDHSSFGDDGAVAVVDLAGKRKVLADGWSSVQGLAWAPQGDEIWFTATAAGGARALRAVTLSGKQRLVARVTGALTIQDIGRDGRVLMIHEDGRMAIQGRAAGEAQERDLSWLDWSLARDISPDGRMILFDESGEGSGGNPAVYIRRFDGSPAIRLGECLGGAFSPDGRWVLCGRNNAPVLLPTRAGTPRTLERGPVSRYGRGAWFPDGKRIIFVGSEAGHDPRAWVQEIDNGKPRPITPEGTAGWLLSPDGRFVAARDREQKALLYPVEGGSPRPVPGVEAGESAIRFSADGRSLYVRQSGALPARIYRLDLATGRKDPWKEITPPDPAGVKAVSSILLAGDEKSYVYSYNRVLSSLYLVDGLR
ncbi:MAG: protein kinase [Acidobacteria bacterium]|nr:protein kinase [Acidobacteriota bacterium]